MYFQKGKRFISNTSEKKCEGMLIVWSSLILFCFLSVGLVRGTADNESDSHGNRCGKTSGSVSRPNALTVPSSNGTRY